MLTNCAFGPFQVSWATLFRFFMAASVVTVNDPGNTLVTTAHRSGKITRNLLCVRPPVHNPRTYCREEL
jgi:hypothetical protein